MLIPKSKFAEHLGRTKAAVSNWIADGRLTAAAGSLVGEGAAQRISVPAAIAELRGSIDAGQGIGNAAATLEALAALEAKIEAGASLDLAPPAPIRARPESAPPRAPMDPLKAEKIRAAELDNLRRERIEAEQAGQWVHREAAANEAAARLAAEIEQMETFLRALSDRIAVEHGGDARAIRRTARRAFRDHRARRAAAISRPKAIAAE